MINPELVESTSDDGKGPYKKKRPSKKQFLTSHNANALVNFSTLKKQQGYRGGKTTTLPQILNLLNPNLPEALKQ